MLDQSPVGSRGEAPGLIRGDRIEKVSSALAAFGVDRVIALEERDPQYHVAARISSILGEGRAAVLLALVALASYRLAMKGEEYWRCLADTVEGSHMLDPLEVAVHFLRSCRGAIVRREAKIRRVTKAYLAARNIFHTLERNPGILPQVYSSLLDTLSKALRAPRDSKTLVFAVKMAYYAIRPRGLRTPFPISIPVPVDVRVSCLTYTSGIVDAGGYREILSKPATARDAWARVARASGVPEIHLDALLWTSGRPVMEGASVERLAAHLDPPGPSGDAYRLASELLWRRCV